MPARNPIETEDTENTNVCVCILGRKKSFEESIKLQRIVLAMDCPNHGRYEVQTLYCLDCCTIMLASFNSELTLGFNCMDTVSLQIHRDHVHFVRKYCICFHWLPTYIVYR